MVGFIYLAPDFTSQPFSAKVRRKYICIHISTETNLIFNLQVRLRIIMQTILRRSFNILPNEQQYYTLLSSLHNLTKFSERHSEREEVDIVEG